MTVKEMKKILSKLNDNDEFKISLCITDLEDTESTQDWYPLEISECVVEKGYLGLETMFKGYKLQHHMYEMFAKY